MSRRKYAKPHALAYTFRDVVTGCHLSRGGEMFAAEVTVSGRAIVHQDDEGTFWVRSVQPDEGQYYGADLREALWRFRVNFLNMTTYLASLARSAKDLERQIRKRVSQISGQDRLSPDFAASWDEAVAAGRVVRSKLVEIASLGDVRFQVRLIDLGGSMTRWSSVARSSACSP